MANPFRDMSVIMQALVAAAIGRSDYRISRRVCTVFSSSAGTQLRGQSGEQRKTLSDEVTQLQVYKQRYGELKAADGCVFEAVGDAEGHRAGRKGSRRVHPHGAGSSGRSNVQMRQFTAQPVVAKEYHYDMPFEIQADGPYFNLLDFFPAA